MRLIFSVLAAMVMTASAAAQLPLPVETPNLPGEPLGRLDDRLDEVRNRSVRDIQRVRLDELTALLRANRDVLERGPQGSVILRRQITALSPTPEALSALLGEGFTVSRREPLSGLGLELVVLEAPARVSTQRALRRARALDPSGAYDFNHVFSRSGKAAGHAGAQAAAPGAPIRAGLIDTGVDQNHPALASAEVITRGFHPTGHRADGHGTHVASLLVGGAPAMGRHVLLVADVYGGSPSGGSAGEILAALSWMAENRVGVINMSLVGPDNRLIAIAIREMITRGHVIVAAVGNDGPSAPVLYPAGYPGVVGVTGVDRSGRVLPEAGRGRHVDFAALGRDVEAAQPGGGWTAVRGTSFAAPAVAALVARTHRTPSPASAEESVAYLISIADDLGPRGRDETYGHGRVDAAHPRTRTAASRSN